MDKSIVMDKLIERGFNQELLAVFNPAVGDQVFTFYLYNLSGQIVGYQQYRPGGSKAANNNPREGRYYTYCQKADRMNSIGGLETYNWSKVLFVVEGLFDAVKLWRRGYACVWLCGIPSKSVQHWLRNQPHPTIALLDPGIDKKMRKCFNSCTVQVSPEELDLSTDLGDMEILEVTNMILEGLSKLSDIGELPDKPLWNIL